MSKRGRPFRRHRPRCDLRCRPRGRPGSGPRRRRRLLGQDGRLGPGVAVPPALARAAGRVRVPPRRRTGIAAVLAHPYILPKRAGPHRARVASAHADLRGGRDRGHRPPAGHGPRGRGTRGDRVLPQPGEGGRPGCARRRSGGRRRLRFRRRRARRAGLAARGRHQPADQPGPVGQPRGGQAGIRRHQPAATRGLGHPGRGRPRRGRAPRRRPEHLVRLPPRPGRAHRGRPAVDRRHRADRQADRIGRRARVGHLGDPAVEGVVCATAPSTDPAPTSRPAASMPP